MKLPTFEYAKPDSISACCKLLEENGATALPIAGGTDLVMALKNWLKTPKILVDLFGHGASPLRSARSGPSCATVHAGGGPLKSCRSGASIHLHRARPHPFGGLALCPLAAHRRQVAVHQVHILKHHIAHLFERDIQRPRPVGLSPRLAATRWGPPQRVSETRGSSRLHSHSHNAAQPRRLANPCPSPIAAHRSGADGDRPLAASPRAPRPSAIPTSFACSQPHGPRPECSAGPRRCLA